MAEEVDMTPVAAEPPQVNPFGGAPVTPPAANIPALKPGLKLPTQNAMRPGLKLPTQNALRPGLKLPSKPVIRKPGATVASTPLPKPVSKADVAKPDEVEKPMDSLKVVTQKLKGITQEIPQQAILRKTGIIAEDATTEAQKEAAKHKTARISLSDAMGVAPVKNENAPMKTIRIKRPIDIPNPTSSLKPQPASVEPKTQAAEVATEVSTEADTKVAESTATTASTITQRKTLKIARPGSAVRPSGKFGVKRASQAATVASTSEAADGAATPATDVAEIPEMPMSAPVPTPKADIDEGPAWLWTLSVLVQAAACVVIGALAWMLFQNTQIAYF